MADDKIRQRVDALLSKTRDNGATEEEELAAMAKAMELIAKYQVDMTKESAKKQGAIMDKMIFNLPLAQFSAFEISGAVQVATGTCIFRRGEASIYFIGLEEDVKFAKWLLLNLVTFGVRSVNEWWRHPDNYMPSSRVTASKRVRIKQSYIKGFARRCLERAHSEKEKIASTGRSLVLVKNDVIKGFMEQNQIAPKVAKDKKKYEAWAKRDGYRKGNEAQLRKVEELQ